MQLDCWIQRAEQVSDESDLDLAVLNQWMAFNSLYGQWDGERHGRKNHGCGNLCSEAVAAGLSSFIDSFAAQQQFPSLLEQHQVACVFS